MPGLVEVTRRRGRCCDRLRRRSGREIEEQAKAAVDVDEADRGGEGNECLLPEMGHDGRRLLVADLVVLPGDHLGVLDDRALAVGEEGRIPPVIECSDLRVGYA